MEMEYNSLIAISNIYADYHPAIYKDSQKIKENVKNLTTNRKKIFLSNQKQRSSQSFENIRVKKGLKT